MSCSYNQSTNSTMYIKSNEKEQVKPKLGTFNFAYAPAEQWASVHQAQVFTVTQQERRAGYPRISYELN